MLSIKDIDWVEIPAGKFLFGLSESKAEEMMERVSKEQGLRKEGIAPYERKKLFSESPQREVYLDTYYVSRFPITHKQYLGFVESNHRFSPAKAYKEPRGSQNLENARRVALGMPNYPEAGLIWHNAMAFCDWLGVRLPTSCEWEKAARGTDGRIYPWGNDWQPTYGNFTNVNQGITPVDAYPQGQSPYGVMDTLGNTYEYTLSTGFYGIQEQVICRSIDYQWDPKMDAERNPTWWRVRITNQLHLEMNFGGPVPVGFRIVMDKWLRQAWEGF